MHIHVSTIGKVVSFVHAPVVSLFYYCSKFYLEVLISKLFVLFSDDLFA